MGAWLIGSGSVKASGHGIVTAGAEGMAAQQAPEGEARAPRGAVTPEGFLGVAAAAWLEAAVAAEEGREGHSIRLNGQQQQALREAPACGAEAAPGPAGIPARHHRVVG